MKTTISSTKRSKVSSERRGYPFVSIDELERRSAPRRARERAARRGKSPEEVRASLIARGILTKAGKLPVYPMDHVPLGPRE
jgi:hypothetical protein